jgi:hypothetical protein
MKSRHLHRHAQLAQVLHEVVGEGIIVVQNQNHVSSLKIPHFLENKSENQFLLNPQATDGESRSDTHPPIRLNHTTRPQRQSQSHRAQCKNIFIANDRFHIVSFGFTL